MKTKLLFFVLFALGISTSGNAQYHHLVDTGRVWTSTMCGFGPFGMNCTTHYFKIENDTIIGSQNYKGVWTTSDSAMINANWFLQGCIREDSAKKVYYVNHSETQERLIYDFDLTVGDTAHLDYHSMPADLVVDSMSTVLIDNQSRNVFYLRPSNTTFFFYYQTWIEGIGSLDELLIMRAPQVDYDSELLCFHENDTLKYYHPNYTDCFFLNTGLKEITQQSRISLLPNPTDGKFTISFPEHFKYDDAIVSIADVSGKVVATRRIISSEKAEMDLSELPAGLYFVRVTGKGFSPMPGKVAVY
jgi:hypothetical protein